MAQIVYAATPDNGDPSFWTTRLTRPIKMGPRSTVHCKSANILLQNAISLNSTNNSFVVRLDENDAATEVRVNLGDAELSSAADLAALIQREYNDYTDLMLMENTDGNNEEVFSTCRCTFAAPTFVLNILGPISAQPLSSGVILSSVVELTPGQPNGTSIQRTDQATAADWHGWAAEPLAPSWGSSVLRAQVAAQGHLDWSGMIGYSRAIPDADDPLPPEQTTVALLLVVGVVPVIYVNGVAVTPSGIIGAPVADGDTFLIYRYNGNIEFKRLAGNGNTQNVVMHVEDNISLDNKGAFVSLYGPGAFNAIGWTPGITLADQTNVRLPGGLAGQRQRLGTVDDNTVKTVTFGNLGLYCGFVPQKTYSAAAAPQATFTSDTPIIIGSSLFPSVNIFVRNLPLLAWDSSGRNAPIVASVPKVALQQLQDGQQLLYTDPAPTPIACRFADEQSITELVFELQDPSGVRVLATGQTQVVLVITNPM